MVRKDEIVRTKIANITFGLISPKYLREISVANINTSDTYDDDGYPMENGLMDSRLGVIDPGLKCRTCGGRVGQCRGHFGHIELTRPVIHVGYAPEIYNLLRITCHECGRAMVKGDAGGDGDEEIAGEESIPEIDFKSDIKECPHCGAKQRKIKFVRPYSYYEEEDGEKGEVKKQKLLVDRIRERLERIRDEDLQILRMKNIRPEWMILSAIPVLPIVARPSITLESFERSEDDLTHKLVDILRINQRLLENINSGAPQLIVEDLWDLLQYHVATYFDNEISGMPPVRHRSGRPLKTLAQRLKSKEGRFRTNLSGKRVNFSARTVVGPDANISINEVGVPELVAKELTVPEEVNEINKKSLMKLIKNFPLYPSATNVITSDSRRKRIMPETKDVIADTLDIGDTVDRQLMDGDVVIFNRQPSLHRVSMMAHHVKVMPHKTFRINTAVCAPYNADFDGDEMNLHVPQSEEARAEADILMKVQENILSPRFGGPLVGGRHDHVTGTYMLTKKESEFSRAEVLQLIGGLTKANLRKKKSYSGKEVFSLFLPEDLDLEYKAKICRQCDKCKKDKCEYDAHVVIKKGKVITGIIDAEGLGGTLLNEIYLKYGSDVTREYIDNTTRLSIRAVMKYGFSTAIDDEDMPEKGVKEIRGTLEATEERVNALVKKYEDGSLEIVPGKTLGESLEAYIMEELGSARNAAGKIAEKYLKDNSAVIMAKIGARGSMLNLTQMAGIVGQQAVRGERIKRGYHNRTLSGFKKGDRGAKAEGFVYSSFKKGLDPKEYFFHSMGGREGLVDTAVRTGRSGYMQRRLINALQDLMVHPDNSVRGNNGIIVQFEYGEDGVDPSKVAYLGKHEHKEWFT